MIGYERYGLLGKIAVTRHRLAASFIIGLTFGAGNWFRWPMYSVGSIRLLALERYG